MSRSQRKKRPKKMPSNAPVRAPDESHDARALLARAFEEDRADAVDDGVDDQREERAADRRDDEVGHFHERSQERQDELPAEERRAVGGDDRAQPDELSRQPEMPAARDLEEHQNGREREEDRLPKRRAGDEIGLHRCSLRCQRDCASRRWRKRVIAKHQRGHRFDHRHGARQHAWIVATAGRDRGLFAGGRDRLLLARDR